FSERNLQSFLPIIFSKASEITQRWITIAEKSNDETAVVDVANWVHRLTLVRVPTILISRPPSDHSSY
ncbi:2690_t:CDS:1, partial [Acaulospora colombiana]